MRFTDLQYVLFLVGAFVVFRAARRWRGFVVLWLLGASLFFYGSWDPRYLWLLGFATLLDYTMGALIAAEMRDEDRGVEQDHPSSSRRSAAVRPRTVRCHSGQSG